MLDHPDAPWQPPVELPHAADLRRGVTVLEGQLRRSDKKHAAYCLSKLFAGFNEKLTAGEIDSRVDVWWETCSGVPGDLWAAGVMELLRTWRRDAHYGRLPDPADLLDVVKARLEKRQTDLQRTQAMLRRANAEAAPKEDAPRREAPIPRLKRILAEQRDDMTVSDADRLFNMSNTERALAFAERRLMADWAQQFFDDRVAASGGRPRDSVGSQAAALAQRSSPTAQRLAELAHAKHTGTTAPDRFAPEHRDIPER